MLANRVPALAALSRPVFQDISDGIALLPTCGETRDRRIPHSLARVGASVPHAVQCAYVPPASPPGCSSNLLATNLAQSVANEGKGRQGET